MTKRIPINILLAIALAVWSMGVVLVPVGSVHAASTIYVDDDNCPGPGTGTIGDPFCSIDTAISDAGTLNGDTVVVAAGTYSQTATGEPAVIVVDKQLNIQGAGSNVTTVDGEQLIPGSLAGIFTILESNVTISGFRFIGTPNPGDEYPAITCYGLFWDLDNITLTENFVDGRNTGLVGIGGIGSIHSFTISNNRISEFWDTGVWIMSNSPLTPGQYDINISGNQITGFNFQGEGGGFARGTAIINMYGGDNTNADISISGNYIEGNSTGEPGLGIYNMFSIPDLNLEIGNNIIKNTTSGISNLYTDDYQIEARENIFNNKIENLRFNNETQIFSYVGIVDWVQGQSSVVSDIYNNLIWGEGLGNDVIIGEVAEGAIGSAGIMGINVSENASLDLNAYNNTIDSTGLGVITIGSSGSNLVAKNNSISNTIVGTGTFTLPKLQYPYPPLSRSLSDYNNTYGEQNMDPGDTIQNLLPNILQGSKELNIYAIILGKTKLIPNLNQPDKMYTIIGGGGEAPFPIITDPADGDMTEVANVGDNYGFYNQTSDSTNMPQGDHNISKDPMFTDSGGGDYSLSANSPLIDAGTSHSADPLVPTTDILGTARPQHPAFDIGAYERVGSWSTVAPTITPLNPIDGATGVGNEQTISFTISDPDSGVDYDSLEYTVTGSISGDIDVSPTTDPSNTYPFLSSVDVTLTPNQIYRDGEEITVWAKAYDNLHYANSTELTWSFTTSAIYEGSGYIATTPEADGGPMVNVFNGGGTRLASWFAFDQSFRGAFHATTGNLRDTAKNEIVITPGPGFGPHLKVFKMDSLPLAETMVYDESFRGGIKAVTGDINGDGLDEIIVAPLSGGPHIKVYRMEDYNLVLMADFMAYDDTFRGELTLATGRVNNEDRDLLMTVPGVGSNGGPHLKVWQYNNGEFTLRSHTMVYDENFRGGTNLNTGDLDGDGLLEIVTSPQGQGGPNVRIYKLDSQNAINFVAGTFAYQEEFRGGVNIATGDINNDKKEEVIVAPISQGGPQLRVYRLDNNEMKLMDSMFVYDEAFRGGLNIAAQDLNDDSRAEIVTAPRSAGGPNVRVYSYQDGLTLNSWFWAFGESFKNGVSLALGERE